MIQQEQPLEILSDSLEHLWMALLRTGEGGTRHDYCGGPGGESFCRVHGPLLHAVMILLACFDLVDCDRPSRKDKRNPKQLGQRRRRSREHIERGVGRYPVFTLPPCTGWIEGSRPI